MQTSKLAFSCPVCGSPDVLYTCEPRCCFNHVCTACKASFLTATEPIGGKFAGLASPGEKESGEPAARCCECRSNEVCTLDDGTCGCPACGARLKLVFLDVEKR